VNLCHPPQGGAEPWVDGQRLQTCRSFRQSVVEVQVQRVAVIDYGSGNLHSAHKAFERAARDSDLNVDIIVTSDPKVVRRADRIVLPGVGAYADCRAGLNFVPGLAAALEDVIIAGRRPFLGICVGMQLIATRGLEYGETSGLDWIKGDVQAILPSDPGLKIPHMGWNTLSLCQPHALLSGIATGPAGLHAYFVHSFHFKCSSSNLVATTDYGGDVTAIVARDNIVGTQFHPEKSQALGLRFIANFLRWQP
jgi:imidazole glycerol-phosphate synthase subunit HisH